MIDLRKSPGIFDAATARRAQRFVCAGTRRNEQMT